MAGNLTKRILFAVIAIPATVGVIWLGGWALLITVAALGVLGAREVYGLARLRGVEPLAGLGYIAACVIPVLIAGTAQTYVPWPFGYVDIAPLAVTFAALLFTGWLLVLLVAAMRRGPEHKPLTSVAVTCFGALYATLPLSFLIGIRHGSPNAPATAGLALVLLPLVLTWICDTAAFMAGSQFGGPKMAPVLSPRKTWSGAGGGVVGALIGAIALGPLVHRAGANLSTGQLLTLGLVVGVVAQVGDVAESLLKREAGVKDSSNLIPGHGGVLDRLDSLYFVIPASAGLYLLYGTI